MSVIGEYIPDNLIVDTKISPLPKEILLKKNQGVLNRGTVLGRVSADGTCVPVDSTKVDGSQSPYCILCDKVDTEKATDVVAVGYFTGVFDGESLSFGGDDNVETHEEALRQLNIHIK